MSFVYPVAHAADDPAGKAKQLSQNAALILRPAQGRLKRQPGAGCVRAAGFLPAGARYACGAGTAAPAWKMAVVHIGVRVAALCGRRGNQGQKTFGGHGDWRHCGRCAVFADPVGGGPHRRYDAVRLPLVLLHGLRGHLCLFHARRVGRGRFRRGVRMGVCRQRAADPSGLYPSGHRHCSFGKLRAVSL